MAAGLPVVSTTVSGIPELVVNDVNGLLVPPEDPSGAGRCDLAIGQGSRARRPVGERRARTRSPSGSTVRHSPVAWRRCSTAIRGHVREVDGPRDRPCLARSICVIDHLHRDIAVAEAARSPADSSTSAPTLDLGRVPDWIDGGLADDVEWRIEWVKLYEGLDLAHAYALTGDDDHLTAWEDLVESFCDQVAVGVDALGRDGASLQNWLYAWQSLRGGADVHRATSRSRRAARLDGSPTTPSTCDSTSRPSATTARSSCTRCWSSGWRFPSATPVWRSPALDAAGRERS